MLLTPVEKLTSAEGEIAVLLELVGAQQGVCLQEPQSLTSS